MTPTERDPGDATGMTIKEMVMELYRDMKVVRPTLEVLSAADLPRRVNALEDARHFALGRREVIAGLCGFMGVLVGIGVAVADRFLI
jgi:hypothetical protein